MEKPGLFRHSYGKVPFMDISVETAPILLDKFIWNAARFRHSYGRGPTFGIFNGNLHGRGIKFEKDPIFGPTYGRNSIFNFWKLFWKGSLFFLGQHFRGVIWLFLCMYLSFFDIYFPINSSNLYFQARKKNCQTVCCKKEAKVSVIFLLTLFDSEWPTVEPWPLST